MDIPELSGNPPLPPWTRNIGSLVVVVVVILFILAGLVTSFYTVPAESVGVVLRFGRYSRTDEPGLQFKLPFGIDRAILVPVRRQLKQEFGFGTPGAMNRTQASTEPMEEKRMVTGDLNSALVEWVIQYRISDSKLYLFKVRNPGETLRDVSESVMREVIGDRTVDEVITIGRQEIEGEALLKMREVVNRYEMGIGIDQVQLKDVNPPEEVQDSFDEVNRAQQERERAINVANGSYNEAVPRARGQAEQAISEARGYALQRVNEAKGDVALFEAVLAQYLKAPEVTRRRLYLETMGKVLPRLGRKVVIDRDASGVLPLLQLDQKEVQR